MYKTNVKFKMVWAPYRGNNGVLVYFLDNKQLRHSPTYHQKSDDERIDSGFYGKGPEAIAFAICRELYGEEIAFQVYKEFAEAFTQHYYRSKGIEVQLDLKGFNEFFLSNVTYYDIAVEARWRYDVIPVGSRANSPRVSLQTMPFLLHNVPVINPQQAEMSEADISAVLQQHATRMCHAQVMATDYVIEVKSFTPVNVTVEQEAEAMA